MTLYRKVYDLKFLLSLVKKISGLLIIYLLLLFCYPLLHIVTLKFYHPSHTNFINQYELHCQQKPCKVSQKWIALAKIDKKLLSAVLSAEDARFFTHEGIDFKELKKAHDLNVRKGKIVRGASTITQQLVKNLYLSKKKSYSRKARELVYTKWMELVLTKDEILELYLNLIEWGQGIYGIAAAAEHYFNKSASNLNIEEAAWLAAIIPNPKAYSGRQSRIGNYRKNLILRRMQAIDLSPLK